jgi:two-component system cell cycle response regulator CpdR
LYTILIVDDDPSVLPIIAQALAEPGYDVLTARDGYEAIRALVHRHVDLMIVDIVMPGLDGVQLAMQATLMRPGLHVIYVTGMALTAPKAPAGKLLQKPLRAADLKAAVRQELATR